jgi:hypothetical protein
MSDNTYNGWMNYETWAVKLWMDNEESSQAYWREVTREVIELNKVAGTPGDTRYALADCLRDAHEEDAADALGRANATVFTDLLNAALSEVNWHEIAQSLLDDAQEGE